MKVAFFTLGCKVNQYETAALQGQFAEAGYEIVNADELADVYVVNSCTVTAEGDRKSRQMLRRMRRRNPAAVVCLCGCFPQAFPGLAEQIPEADVIMGAKNRSRLLGAVGEVLSGGGRVVEITSHEKGEKFEALNAGRFYSRTRAFLKIEDGCPRRCSYCIIPAARGPVRSKPPEELKAELKSLAASGYAEVVLAGVNLSCYGQDLGLHLIDAVKLACETQGIGRVRLSSLEPELLTREDISEMSRLKKLCPHFHLSLQSGCDATLKRMKRHYTAQQYREMAGDLRAAFDNCALTTDIMVGFPGETDEEFSQSLKFCRDIGFARAHVFSYSKRPGTAAAEMPEQVPESVKRERSKLMTAAVAETRAAFLQSQLSRQTEALFETRRPDGRWEGYSENYTPILMDSRDDLSGRILALTPETAEEDFCVARQE